jgi:hypothetical protein
MLVNLGHASDRRILPGAEHRRRPHQMSDHVYSFDRQRQAGWKSRQLPLRNPVHDWRRELDSLDLRKELPKIGLPQFCRQADPPATASAPDGPAAQAIALWSNTRFLDSLTGKEVRAWTTIANMVDVECASLQRQQPGLERLTVRLNEYAEKLVLERMGKEEIKADTCAGRFPLLAIGAARDASGHTLFTYGLSQNRMTAERQRACIATQIKLQPTCGSR